MNRRVLVFAEDHLPGYKAGGPIRSIEGLVRSLGSEIEFFIVTRDCDFGDQERYSIATGDWQERDGSHVRYVRPSLIGGPRQSAVERDHA